MSLLTDSEVARLQSQLNAANITDPQNVALLQHLTMQQRDEFAVRSGTRVLYIGQEEVEPARRAEETAALKAAPTSDYSRLNGLNIGAGDRAILPTLIPVDISKGVTDGTSGAHHAFLPHSILALPDNLPFRDSSMDFIVSLHMLEHVPNPVEVVLHWLDIIKPGGGIGVVVPDWRFNWDARTDGATLGHKWNSTPELVAEMYARHWSHAATLEHIRTLPFGLSFDFVLRKHGTFQPFVAPDETTLQSGFQLAQSGRMVGLTHPSSLSRETALAR